MPECFAQVSRTCTPVGSSFHNSCLVLLFDMFTSNGKMTAFHELWALMSFKTKPQQIFKTVWELLPCSNQNLFFQGIFVCFRNRWYRMLCLIWFVHLQKGYPFWSLEHQSRNKLRAGSPFLPKCLVRCSKSYSQEQIVCSWDSHLIHWSCLICSIVPGPAWPEKPC